MYYTNKNSSVFKIKKFNGIQCNINTVDLALLKVPYGAKNLGFPPCWVNVYIYILYTAAKKLIKIRHKVKYFKNNIMAGKIIISLKRLIVGGTAILIAENKNHQSDKIGKDNNNPLTI